MHARRCNRSEGLPGKRAHNVKAFAESPLYKQVISPSSIDGFLRMPLSYVGCLTGDVLPAVVHTRLRAYRPPADAIFLGAQAGVSSYMYSDSYAASCGCPCEGRLCPGMPSLRSCIPRLRYLQTSSTGCHIPIFGVHPSFIDGFLRMPTRGGLPYRRCPPCGRTYPATSLQASCGCHILGRVFFRTDSRWRGGRRVICRMIPCCSILFCLYRRGRGFLYRGRLG